MKREKVYLVGTHRYSFRAGEPAEIIGVEMTTPKQLLPRLSYHIRFSDYVEDWVAIDDGDYYKIITFTDIINGKIPQVTS